MTYFLHILQSIPTGKIYIGIYANPEQRLFYQNSLEKDFTAIYRLWKIVFYKEYPSKETALTLSKKSEYLYHGMSRDRPKMGCIMFKLYNLQNI
jgi:predicted GIY-YIG superfamily endonuclease